MDVLEGIMTRRSVRAFKPDTVPRETLEKVLDAARYAPSWGNTQSWELIVLGGRRLDGIRRALETNETAGQPQNPDFQWPEFTGQYADRRRDLALRILERFGFSEEDGDARRQLGVRNIRFFEAPHAIIATADKLVGPYALLDLGIVLQTVALAAHDYGLGTCLQAKPVTFPDVLREALRIPDNRLIALGMAIGYPNPDAEINSLERERLPLDGFVTWHDQ